MKTTPYIYVLLFCVQTAFAQVQKEEKDSNLIICGFLERKPEFPGGEKALMQYWADNLNFSGLLDLDSFVGSKIFINFTIEKDGSVINVKVLRGIHPFFDEEAARVVRAMPKWAPAIQNGLFVKMERTLPITIRID